MDTASVVKVPESDVKEGMLMDVPLECATLENVGVELPFAGP
jgi:hypothetical protein